MDIDYDALKKECQRYSDAMIQSLERQINLEMEKELYDYIKKIPSKVYTSLRIFSSKLTQFI